MIDWLFSEDFPWRDLEKIAIKGKYTAKEVFAFLVFQKDLNILLEEPNRENPLPIEVLFWLAINGGKYDQWDDNDKPKALVLIAKKMHQNFPLLTKIRNFSSMSNTHNIWLTLIESQDEVFSKIHEAQEILPTDENIDRIIICSHAGQASISLGKDKITTNTNLSNTVFTNLRKNTKVMIFGCSAGKRKNLRINIANHIAAHMPNGTSLIAPTKTISTYLFKEKQVTFVNVDKTIESYEIIIPTSIFPKPPYSKTMQRIEKIESEVLFYIKVLKEMMVLLPKNIGANTLNIIMITLVALGLSLFLYERTIPINFDNKLKSLLSTNISENRLIQGLVISLITATVILSINVIIPFMLKKTCVVINKTYKGLKRTIMGLFDIIISQLPRKEKLD